MIHAKKILPIYYKAMLTGRKTFELRREEPDEPPYCAGDYLALNEWAGNETPVGSGYTGRCLLYEITYVLRDFELLQPDAVVLGLRLKPLSFEDLDAAYRQK